MTLHVDGSAEPPQEAARCRELFDAVRIHDLSAELDLIIRPKGDEFNLRLQSENGDDFATISCVTKPGSRQIRVNNVTAPLGLGKMPMVGLHLFLDGSVLELFANLETALTARIYRVLSSPLRLKLDDSAEIISFNAWRMQPISKDRLTGSLCS
jgi:hypothetical protein